MSLTEDFLSANEEAEIVQAIQIAENLTSGEIRVHIEAHADSDVLTRAKDVFFQLNMNKTNARNGVLFYIGVQDHTFAIVGDEGIDKVVAPDFWECTKDVVLTHFKNKQFKEGLVAGILNAGEQLKKYFPYEGSDKDELSNEISRG